jgi:multiple sugar transport system permease protein
MGPRFRRGPIATLPGHGDDRREADATLSTRTVLTVATDRPRVRMARLARLVRLPRVSRDGLSTVAFLLPLLLIFGVFSWFPIVRAIVMSVQETNLVATPTFVGADNFARVLADPLFWRAVANTAYFTILALILGFPIPLVLAVIMSEARRFRGLYSALAYIPVVIPPVVAVLLWRLAFFDPRPAGVFNTILGSVGIGPLPWLQNAATAMPSIVLEATWAAAGGTVIIYLAALLSVPPELYDAAEVDGA